MNRRMSPNVDLQVKWYTHAQLRKKFQQRFGEGGVGSEVLDGGSTTRMDILLDRVDPSNTSVEGLRCEEHGNSLRLRS